MPPVGFEPTISAGERPQNYALDRAATGTGRYGVTLTINYMLFVVRHPDDGHRSERNILVKIFNM